MALKIALYQQKTWMASICRQLEPDTQGQFGALPQGPQTVGLIVILHAIAFAVSRTFLSVIVHALWPTTML